ncbi:MAG: glycosyltransferase, partial [Planctomycetota bacterium]
MAGVAEAATGGRPLRIVHVITRLIVGGAQENTLLSCEGQHAAGHDVTLICGPETGPEGSLLQRAKASGIRVEIDEHLRRELRPVRDWRALRSLKARFRRLRPDVVHTHSSKAGILGRAAAWATGGRDGRMLVVHTIHGLAFTTSTRKFVNTGYVAAEKFAAKRCHLIACVATAMADQS